jgi:DNA-binding transcriptional ArsR family regulator
MLEVILGNKTAAKVMLYLFHYGEAHASVISKDLEITLSQVQKQLSRFEEGDILVSKKVGNIRVYQFNPKAAASKKLKELIELYYNSIPIKEREKVFKRRARPRKKDKEVLS